ncbi:hypothetical protein PIB30_076749 [Stylosanthes scabra]|uniref:Uncharacterized protein n=1 Tax=Stylosanthes scabra TaxID=79078 RepID=A0ABU6UPW7_9FABA|nr:hypothetical protein [Stylosanthes scabra]
MVSVKEMEKIELEIESQRRRSRRTFLKEHLPWLAPLFRENNKNLKAQLLRQSILLSPPPLLAAAFSWDRSGGYTGDRWHWRSDDSSEDKAIAENYKEGQQRSWGENWTAVSRSSDVVEEGILTL